MRKEKHFTEIVDDIRIDFRFEIAEGKIKHFCINICISENEHTEDVFRVDTAHKGLHVQKFWISEKPEYIEDIRKGEYNTEFNYWRKEVFENFKRWAKLYKDSRGEKNEEHKDI